MWDEFKSICAVWWEYHIGAIQLRSSDIMEEMDGGMA